MAVEIIGGSSTANKANVDAGYNLKANLGTDQSLAGFAGMLSEADSGDVLGTRTTYAAEVNGTYRLRIGVEQPMFFLSFEGTNIARDRIQQNDTTATAAQSLGYLTLNSGSSVTSGQGTNIRTYRTFPLFSTYPTYGIFTARVPNYTATNSITEFGFGYCSGVTAQLTDGAYFRVTSGGTLRAIITSSITGSGVDVVDQAITTTNIPNKAGGGAFDLTLPQDYLIEVNSSYVHFWINDVLAFTTVIPSSGPLSMLSTSQPLFARTYFSGAASSARQLGIGAMSCIMGDMNNNNPYPHAICGMGGGAYQIQPGTTSGPTVTRGAATLGWPTSATVSTTGTWTATTAPALNSLGGMWVSPAISTLTTGADYPVFSYANPAGTATLPGKTLYITGIHWGKTVAQAAASTNSIILQYILTVGGTSSATTQTEGAAIVAARGTVLDTIAFKSTAVICDYVEGGDMQFSSPLVCYPGTFVVFAVRPTGTVASNTLTVTGTVAFNGYFV